MARIRLDKLLANMGKGSRSEIKKAILQGAVTVDGQVLRSPAAAVDPEQQRIALRGELIAFQRYWYLMMNKPAGVLSASRDRNAKTVMDLLGEPWKGIELFVAGRLDRDTEGLLLLTNDGAFAHNLLSPKKHVDKTYFAQVDGIITRAELDRLEHGILLEPGFTTLPARAVLLRAGADCSEVELTIREGKFHQVKRMFAAVGHPVRYLRRVAVGGLQLPADLPLGQVQELSMQQLAQIGVSCSV